MAKRKPIVRHLVATLTKEATFKSEREYQKFLKAMQKRADETGWTLHLETEDVEEDDE